MLKRLAHDHCTGNHHRDERDNQTDVDPRPVGIPHRHTGGEEHCKLNRDQSEQPGHIDRHAKRSILPLFFRLGAGAGIHHKRSDQPEHKHKRQIVRDQRKDVAISGADRETPEPEVHDEKPVGKQDKTVRHRGDQERQQGGFAYIGPCGPDAPPIRVISMLPAIEEISRCKDRDGGSRVDQRPDDNRVRAGLREEGGAVVRHAIGKNFSVSETGEGRHYRCARNDRQQHQADDRDQTASGIGRLRLGRRDFLPDSREERRFHQQTGERQQEEEKSDQTERVEAFFEEPELAACRDGVRRAQCIHKILRSDLSRINSPLIAIFSLSMALFA